MYSFFQECCLSIFTIKNIVFFLELCPVTDFYRFTESILFTMWIHSMWINLQKRDRKLLLNFTQREKGFEKQAKR